MQGDDEQEKKPNEFHAQHSISELQSPIAELDGGGVSKEREETREVDA
jgi:hypothetical protein